MRTARITSALALLAVSASGARVDTGLGDRIDVETASGDAPSAGVVAVVDDPFRFALRVTERVSQEVEGSYTVDCRKGHRTRREDEEIKPTGRRVYRAKPTLRNPESCYVSASAYSSGRGRIKVELLAKVRQ